MDLSRLSNEELLALRDGDYSKLSNETLAALRDSTPSQQESPGFGNWRDLVSGANRTIGNLGDSLVAGYNLMLPKSQEVRPLTEGMRSAGIDLDRPRSYLGMVGEYAMPGPGGPIRNIAQTGIAAAGGYLARQVAPDSALAEIAGSVAAPMAIPGAQAGIRALFRGADPTQMAENVARADALGAPLTVGTASKTPWAMTLERLSGSVPGGVNKFRAAGKAASSAIKEKLLSVAGGEADDVVRSGRLIQRGLFDPDTGWTARTKQTNDALWAKMDENLSANDWWSARGAPDAYPQTVSGGRGAWPDARWTDDVAPIMREPPPSPNPYGRATGLNRRQMLIGRTPENIPTSPEVSLPASATPAAAGAPRGFQALNTRQFINSANKGVEGAPTLSKSLFKDKEVQDFFTWFADDLEAGSGNVPYAAIKRLRTEVGDLLGDPQLLGSHRRDLLKKFYASLTDDMEAAAVKMEERGIKGAVQSFNRANSYHKARIERIEDFYETLHKKTTPEEVWSAVIGDSPKSASRISAIRKGLTPEEWQYIRKTVITRMGKPVASAAKEGDEINFAAGTFLTNYNRMKDKGALSAIFGNGQYRKDLDTVARYASDLRESAEVLSNPSGTAGLGLAASIYYGALGMVGMGIGGGPVAGLVGIGSGLVANNTVARLMNNQRFVHWLAQSTKIPAADIANHLKRLPIIIGNDPNGLEDAQEFLDAVSQMQ